MASASRIEATESEAFLQRNQAEPNQVESGKGFGLCPRRPCIWVWISFVMGLIITIVVLVAALTQRTSGSSAKKDQYYWSDETKSIRSGTGKEPIHVDPQDADWSLTVTNKGRAKKGELIFRDEFSTLDLDKWEHEITMSGGGNWEFQIYRNNRSNSYVKKGILYIQPTLTSDEYGEDFLKRGHIHLGGQGNSDKCTNDLFHGCQRTGTATNILNPILSARLRTINTFAFKYGRVEVKAKLPVGDWLWPAIWMMPQKNQYGGWPASGEIDIMESRGNRKLYNRNGQNIGVEQVGSTLHFGPHWSINGWDKAHFDYSSRADQGFDRDFHLYQLDWTPEYLRFSVDGQETGTVKPGKGGFWELGQFSSRNVANPWEYGENDEMAPFDQKFYLILNVAVGGTNGYFTDDLLRPAEKPWKNDSPQAMLDFWNDRRNWEPTWKEEDSALQVDYVRVWAL